MEITIGQSLTVFLGSLFMIFISYQAKDRVAFILSGFSLVPLLFANFIRDPFMMSAALIVLAMIMLIFDTFPSE